MRRNSLTPGFSAISGRAFRNKAAASSGSFSVKARLSHMALTIAAQSGLSFASIAWEVTIAFP